MKPTRSLLFSVLSVFTVALVPPLWAAELPSWIWTSDKGAADGEEAYIRMVFQAGAREKGLLAASCDNEMVIFINGKPVGRSTAWEEPRLIDISQHLVEGDNLLAVRAVNRGAGSAGFIGKLVLGQGDSQREIVSGPEWRIAGKAQKGWNTATGLEEKGWKRAVPIATAGEGPWAAKITATTLDSLSLASEPQATSPATMKVKEGFKVELLYTVPLETEGSWVVSCFDDKGRLIVSDQYGALYRVTPPEIGGEAAETRVEKLPAEIGEAQGLCYAFGALYVVTNSTKYPRGLYRVTDSDGDDMLDKVELLRKFAEAGGEHGPHAVLPSPDGESLYVVVGNQTPVTEIDVSRVPQHWAEDNLLEPPLVGRGFMQEVMAPGGWVAKTDRDGKKWELITTGFRNQYDAAFNKDGALFTFDADMEWDFNTPWYRATRVCEVISGGDFGWRALSKKWPVRWEDGLPPVVDIGPGSPTGVTFGYGAKFPEKYQDAFYIADWSYGKLYAVHLKPEGAGYTAEFEEFITANPLPLTSVRVSPKDGAMYFLIGGRRVQSGLYRVTADEAATPEPYDRPSAPPLLDLRRQLEAFHGKTDTAAISAAWPHLAHEDRLIRHAARIALEHQPLAGWKDRALAEKDPRASLHALMALCRAGGGDPALLPQVLRALHAIDFDSLAEDDKATLVRNYQLAFARLGRPDDSANQAVISRLGKIFPSGNPWIDVDLAEILIFLRDSSVVAKAVAIMETAPTQEEQIAHAKNLRLAEAGWTPELRERFFKWVVLRAPTYKGGASFPMFMEDLRKDAIARLSEGEKEALKAILEAKPDIDTPQFDYSGRKFVKDWTVEDLEPLLAVGLEGGRNFDNGRNVFGSTACFACHRFGPEGGAMGPDLTSVAGKYSPRDLLVHIIEPNKEISDQYGQLQVTMTDGSTFFGRIMNLAGEDIMFNIDMMNPDAINKVNRKRIKSMEQSKTSMMPPGLLNTCSDEDILDLLAYLLSKGDRSSPLFE
jgi:putative heme-binding domain-containing protein